MTKDSSINTLAACAFCDSKSLDQIMDFGDVALAGAFLKETQFAEEKKHPLRLCFCRECYAVQVIDKVDPSVLFSDYFYFSSSIKTLCDHFTEYAEEICSRFLVSKDSAIIEIGCNDGILLKPLADKNISTIIGVDPASNIVNTICDARIKIINDFFCMPVAKKIIESHGLVDMVVANNVYAHIPDIQGVTQAIHDVLKLDGVFIFEVHYLGRVINELQYDMIYHEHLYYYSLLSAINHFKRYGMIVFDVKAVPTHAGSMRFYVCKSGSKHAESVSEAVNKLLEEERSIGFNLSDTFSHFAKQVSERKATLMELLSAIRQSGKTIAGYGASGRANTMIQYCGIDHTYLDFMIDDAPAKHGFFTPGSHLKIHSSSALCQPNPPDYVLIFAWSFFKEITEKNQQFLQSGGKMIVPLPEVRILP
jgi:SAM-dependent methyltransferase